ncbi:MAG: hypothetical protein MHM6MM_003538 [Cercozoa sp. M6MM]
MVLSVITFLQCFALLAAEAQRWPWPATLRTHFAWLFVVTLDAQAMGRASRVLDETVTAKWSGRREFLDDQHSDIALPWAIAVACLPHVLFGFVACMHWLEQSLFYARFESRQRAFGALVSRANWSGPYLRYSMCQLLRRFARRVAKAHDRALDWLPVLVIPTALHSARLCLCDGFAHVRVDKDIECSIRDWRRVMILLTGVLSFLSFVCPLLWHSFRLEKSNIVFNNTQLHDRSIATAEVEYLTKASDTWQVRQMASISSFRRHAAHGTTLRVLESLLYVFIVVVPRAKAGEYSFERNLQFGLLMACVVMIWVLRIAWPVFRVTSSNVVQSSLDTCAAIQSILVFAFIAEWQNALVGVDALVPMVRTVFWVPVSVSLLVILFARKDWAVSIADATALSQKHANLLTELRRTHALLRLSERTPTLLLPRDVLLRRLDALNKFRVDGMPIQEGRGLFDVLSDTRYDEKLVAQLCHGRARDVDRMTKQLRDARGHVFQWVTQELCEELAAIVDVARRSSLLPNPQLELALQGCSANMKRREDFLLLMPVEKAMVLRRLSVLTKLWPGGIAYLRRTHQQVLDTTGEQQRQKNLKRPIAPSPSVLSIAQLPAESSHQSTFDYAMLPGGFSEDETESDSDFDRHELYSRRVPTARAASIDAEDEEEAKLLEIEESVSRAHRYMT